jgi:hypothetical protein
MQRRVAAFFVFAFASAPLHFAAAAGLPEIKANTSNAVPECVTPGRLTEFLKSRNPDLSPRFDGIATEYMRLGEKLGVRWDFAFYQMILETGSLKFHNGRRAGDVKPTQNNFAGLGATGGGEPGESFKDLPTGVRAHLEHLLLYAGEKLENPTADRTRKVQEWGVLTKWQARFTKPITFSDLAQQWAPGSGGYARMLDGIAERFQEFCDKPDPRPELAAAVKRELRLAEARAERPSGAELAKRAIEAGKAEENARRSALGAQEPATARTPPVPFKVLNAPPEPDKLAADTRWRPSGKGPRHPPKAEPHGEVEAAPAARHQRLRPPPGSRSSRSPLPPAPPSRWSRPLRPRDRSAASGPQAMADRRRSSSAR